MSALLTWFSLLFFGAPLSATAPELESALLAKTAQAEQQEVERSTRSNTNSDDENDAPPFWSWINNPISNGF